jgi:hypothetical protein
MLEGRGPPLGTDELSDRLWAEKALRVPTTRQTGPQLAALSLTQQDRHLVGLPIYYTDTLHIKLIIREPSLIGYTDLCHTVDCDAQHDQSICGKTSDKA